MYDKKGFWRSVLICLIGAGVFNAVLMLIMFFLNADQRLGAGYILAAHDMFIFPIGAVVLGVVGKFKGTKVVKVWIIGYLIVFYIWIFFALLFGGK